jgi:F0F1-type ATP synthase gamma subunit
MDDCSIVEQHVGPAPSGRRAKLVDEAPQNAGRLTDELQALIQTARRQAITREMQELAAGAALLG